MHNFSISGELRKILKKLSKKDNKLYQQVLKKMEEIVDGDAGHYKNLRRPMQHFKRVHVGSFALVFKYDGEKDEIIFEDFQHHDFIYL